MENENKTNLTLAKENEAYNRKLMEYYQEKIKILESDKDVVCAKGVLGSDNLSCDCSKCREDTKSVGVMKVKFDVPDTKSELEDAIIEQVKERAYVCVDCNSDDIILDGIEDEIHEIFERFKKEELCPLTGKKGYVKEEDCHCFCCGTHKGSEDIIDRIYELCICGHNHLFIKPQYKCQTVGCWDCDCKSFTLQEKSEGDTNASSN